MYKYLPNFAWLLQSENLMLIDFKLMLTSNAFTSYTNRPFPTYFEAHYEREAKCKAFDMNISFVYIWMKTNFHNKNFARSLALIMRFKATRKQQQQSLFVFLPCMKCKNITNRIGVLATWNNHRV